MKHTLEALQAIRASRVKTKSIESQSLGTITIRELSAADYIEIDKARQAENRLEIVVTTCSRAIVNGDGARYLDCADGRALLADLSLDELTSITDEIYAHSGLIGVDEKN